MERKTASKETIDFLINNFQKTIADSEHLLRNVELIKSIICNKDLLKNKLQMIFELLSGSLLGMYEVCSSFKSMLLTDAIYAKRYHMQIINLSQYEWCVYLCGKNRDGVLPNLINLLNEQHYDILGLEEILQQVNLLGKKCNAGLRKMTAHYDEPYIMYEKLITLNNEDVYAQRVGDQLLIHNMIFKYVSPVLQEVVATLCIEPKGYLNNKKIGDFSIRDILNDKVADAFDKKEELNILIIEQMASAWGDIESLKRMYDTCEKAIAFLKSKQLDYNRFKELKSIVEMRLIVNFMRCDLECSMNSYLNASSNIERSICFMRVYRLKISALTHLYGYNEERRHKSLWCKIKSIPEFKTTSLSDDIEKILQSLTSHFDCTKRNLYTHYREGEKLNISDRWQCASKMNHPKELMQILQLVTLCKKINQYLCSLIFLMDSTAKKKNNKMLETIQKIKELGCKNNLSDIVDMSDKLLSMFSLSSKKL